MLEYINANINVGKVPILENISVQFDKGKITTIIGPNGCGKTTLLQALNGMSTLTLGQILLDGKNYLGLGNRERAKQLSFLPQFRESAPNISVKVLVEHGRFAYMGFSRKMDKEDKEAVQNALEYTNVCDYKDCMVSELSGGLQQRVYLAMQLAQNSPYLVMDEPMNHLDFPAQREMYGLIKDLGNRGKTIILVLHDLNQALRISDKLVVMRDREIVCTSSPQECLESRIIEEVFGCSISAIESKSEKQYLFT